MSSFHSPLVLSSAPLFFSLSLAGEADLRAEKFLHSRGSESQHWVLLFPRRHLVQRHRSVYQRTGAEDVTSQYVSIPPGSHTHTHTHWDAINVDWIMSLRVSLVHMFYSNVLSPTHAACSALSSAPDLAKPGTHLHIYLIYQPICPAPPPIHPSTFDCAFLPPLGRSLSYAAKASWQMEMEHRLMSRSSFSSPSFHFFPLYQCLMSLKGRNCLPLTG